MTTHGSTVVEGVPLEVVSPRRTLWDQESQGGDRYPYFALKKERLYRVKNGSGVRPAASTTQVPLSHVAAGT